MFLQIFNIVSMKIKKTTCKSMRNLFYCLILMKFKIGNLYNYNMYELNFIYSLFYTIFSFLINGIINSRRTKKKQTKVKTCLLLFLLVISSIITIIITGIFFQQE